MGGKDCREHVAWGGDALDSESFNLVNGGGKKSKCRKTGKKGMGGVEGSRGWEVHGGVAKWDVMVRWFQRKKGVASKTKFVIEENHLHKW